MKASERSKRGILMDCAARAERRHRFQSAASSKAPSPLRSGGAVHEGLVHWQPIRNWTIQTDSLCRSV